MRVHALGWSVGLALLLGLQDNTLVARWLDGHSLAVREASVGFAVLVEEVEGVAREVGAAAGLARDEVGIS